MTAHRRIAWPEGKTFAFSVFDDTDKATLANVAPVYEFLADCGLRTTKSVWPISGDSGLGHGAGVTCEDPEYLAWLQRLQSRGFEMAWHSATWHAVARPQIIAAMEKFSQLFNHAPAVAANHSRYEGIYWAEHRLTGLRASLYNLMTRYKKKGVFRGHIEGDEFFWGDLCREKIKYFRNFVFPETNTLAVCPFMPYHDPLRPYVNYWFASANGSDVPMFNRRISEVNQDRLEAEGGACIMYTHFAFDFAEGQRVNPEFARLVRRLAGKSGWFVPVSTLLDHLLAVNGRQVITNAQRRRLEWKWLFDKIRNGSC